MSGRYDELLYLPHHRSPVHPPLSARQRAAQFAPFAALTGYEAVVAEEGRLTEGRAELDEAEQQRLDALLRQAAEGGVWRFTWFVPDSRKAGGAAVTRTGTIRRLDCAAGTVELSDRTRFPLRELVAIARADRV